MGIIKIVRCHLAPILILGLLMFCRCSQLPPEPPIPDHKIATMWSEMVLYITQHTPQNSPTYASRCMGYIGLTMYESAVPGDPVYKSVAPQLNQPPLLPVPGQDEAMDSRLAFNAGTASILKLLYRQTSEANNQKIDSLEKRIVDNIRKDVTDKDVIQRSISYGRSIAESIFQWSQNDGGHRAYLHNFDKTFEHPEHPGSWKPPLYAQSFSHHPLHPYWGTNRTFLRENADLDDPYMIPYDTAVNSPYYLQFKSVYDKDMTLTQKDKEIAIWWGDDPDVTFTPPGHSFYLANCLIKKYRPSLVECAETYARVGMSIADAFINCWKWKYHFFSERPNTFIPRFIDQEWESFWPDPPFPAFPSGHAIQAAAAACVLMDLYDNQTPFIDSSHVGRERDDLRNVDFVARPFETIWDVALETADSRWYGGIHVPQDNEVGLTEGVRIAENVNRLDWKLSKGE